MATPPVIAPEVEAYLEGSYAAYLSKLDRNVPPWVWLNRCAHSDVQLLRSLSSAHVGDLWPMAERVLVQELLAIVGDDEGMLFRIQHQILIPLELAFIDGGDELTAEDLVFSVRAALRSSFP